MGTDITDAGFVVCDVCGIGFDTLSLSQSGAAWLAGLAGPICAERRAERVVPA